MKSALILVLSPLFVIGVFGESESVTNSVTEGDSLPLYTGIKIQGSDEVEWSFNGKVIYVISIVAGDIKVLDQTDGAFGGRLEVDKQSGDLKITKIKTTDSGQYTLNISRTKGSSKKIFNVDVSRKQPDEVKPDPGLSSGVIAGIVIAVLAVVAAAIGGIYYGYRKKGEML